MPSDVYGVQFVYITRDRKNFRDESVPHTARGS